MSLENSGDRVRSLSPNALSEASLSEMLTTTSAGGEISKFVEAPSDFDMATTKLSPTSTSLSSCVVTDAV